jgi:plastocyanin
MFKHRVIAGFMITAIALSALGAGCNKNTDTKTKNNTKLPRKDVTVEIKDFAFRPETVTIGVLSRVTWTNKDTALHTVVGKNFDSGPLGEGESYSYEFMKPGTFSYKCRLHPYMEGTVVVK